MGVSKPNRQILITNNTNMVVKEMTKMFAAIWQVAKASAVVATLLVSGAELSERAMGGDEDHSPVEQCTFYVDDV
ncbi:MAG: hypothetical protein AAGL23_01500 [Pseudomonadota bacterium]